MPFWLALKARAYQLGMRAFAWYIIIPVIRSTFWCPSLQWRPNPGGENVQLTNLDAAATDGQAAGQAEG